MQKSNQEYAAIDNAIKERANVCSSLKADVPFPPAFCFKLLPAVSPSPFLMLS